MVERAELQGEITADTQAGGQKPSRFSLRSEIITAVGAVIGPAPWRKPALAAPCVALARDRLEDCDPPVEQDEDQKPDDPADHGPDYIVNPEQNEPKAAVPLAFMGQHGAIASAARTLDVQRHLHRPLSVIPKVYQIIPKAVKGMICKKIFRVSEK